MKTISNDKTEALQKELELLNSEVTAVLAKRKKWMDDHMTDFAKFKVGDEIYNLQTGQYLGVISKLYRYWGEDHRDPQYDTAMNVEYQYHTGNNCYDNTSRQHIIIGTNDDLISQRQWDLDVAKFRRDGFDPLFAP